MTQGLFGWVDVAVPDMERAVAFYGSLMGWEVSAADTGGSGAYGLAHRDGKLAAGIGLLSDEQVKAGEQPVWTSYVLVDDADDIAKRASALGGTVAVPPFTIPDAGRVTYVADPGGALLGYWQPMGMAGSDEYNVPGFLCWNELWTRHLAASQDFYRTLLEWDIDEQEPEPGFRYTMVKLGGRENAGMFDVTGMRPDDMPAHWHVYLTVDDIEEALESVRAGGGSTPGEIRQSSFGPIGGVVDPFGAAFRVIQMTG